MFIYKRSENRRLRGGLKSKVVAMPTSDQASDIALILFYRMYRLGHPENYLNSLQKLIFTGSEYPRNHEFNFENKGATLRVLNAR